MRWLLFIALPAVLFSDDCRQPSRLWQASHTPYANLHWLASQPNAYQQQALEALTQRATEEAHKHWLKMAAALGSSPAAFALANHDGQISQYLIQAANGGLPEAQLELALLSTDPEQKEQLLTRAAKQGLQQAIISLYQWYLLQDAAEQRDNAIPWLEKAANSRHGPSTLLYAKYLWHQGEHPKAVEFFKLAEQLSVAKAADYHKLAADYSSKGVNVFPISYHNEQCQQTLRFLVDSLDGAVKAKELVRQFRQDKRLASLPICVEAISWLPEDRLDCQANWRTSKRISCDLVAIADDFASSEATHGVIIAQQGKANVHNGLMYLDLADSYQVFVHELAHFAGFVDEYPLSEFMAERFCTQQVHPNLVIQAESNTDQAKPGYPARTCNNHSSQAYKPVAQMTFMEFYDEGVVPDVYLSLWHQQLQKGASVPAFVNFSQHYSGLLSH